jgi:hypothetical protein
MLPAHYTKIDYREDTAGQKRIEEFINNLQVDFGHKPSPIAKRPQNIFIEGKSDRATRMTL